MWCAANACSWKLATLLCNRCALLVPAPHSLPDSHSMTASACMIYSNTPQHVPAMQGTTAVWPRSGAVLIPRTRITFECWITLYLCPGYGVEL